jgi:hypothetical protein
VGGDRAPETTAVPLPFAGFNMAVFTPEDLALPRASPGDRRRFLDWGLQSAAGLSGDGAGLRARAALFRINPRKLSVAAGPVGAVGKRVPGSPRAPCAVVQGRRATTARRSMFVAARGWLSSARPRPSGLVVRARRPRSGTPSEEPDELITNTPARAQKCLPAGGTGRRASESSSRAPASCRHASGAKRARSAVRGFFRVRAHAAREIWSQVSRSARARSAMRGFLLSLRVPSSGGSRP